MTKEDLIARIERETNRMHKHQLEIEGNKATIARAKKLLKDRFNYEFEEM